MFFINGAYVREEEAKISVLDIGLLRGFGVFEYLRTYQGKPFQLWEHLKRLSYSAEEIGLTLPYSLEEIAEIVDKVQLLSGLSEASIKLVVTGGVSPDQFTPQEKGSLIVFAYPLKRYPDACYTQGVEVITTPQGRFFPTCKSTQYLSGIVALKKGRIDAPMEALYLNQNEEILEATTSNFFGVQGRTLLTCDSSEVLLGITREVVLQLAKDRFNVELRSVRREEIGNLTEAFLTASNKEIMPIVSIDGEQVGSGIVGPVTKELMGLFAEYTAQHKWADMNIARYEKARV
jgi:branched-chain amino acid aminotransferase